MNKFHLSKTGHVLYTEQHIDDVKYFLEKFAIDHLFMIAGYVLAALMANMLPGSILVVGLLATLVVNLYVVFVSKFITMLSNYEIFMYGFTNVLFNVILFVGFGDIIFKLMNFL